MQAFIVAALSLIICSCKMTYIHTYAGTLQLNCLNQAGYLDQTFIWAVYSYTTNVLRTSADPKTVLNITSNKPFIVLRIQEVKYQNSPSLEALMYASILNNIDFKMIWVTLFDQNTNCAYLLQFIKGLQRNLKTHVGVGTWKQNFKSWNNCQQLGAYPLLWYQGPITTKFEPFGPWTSDDLKLSNNIQEKCNIYQYEVMVDLSKSIQKQATA